jgi:hypothetical protein
MTKQLLFLFVFAATFVVGKAQNSPIHICIKDSISKQNIAYATVQIIDKKKTLFIANENGYLLLNIAANRQIAIVASGYFFDTITILPPNNWLASDTFIIELQPIVYTLKDVVVKAKQLYNAYQQDSLARNKEFYLLLGSMPVKAFSNSASGAGIGINLDKFYGREKRKRKAIVVFNLMEQEAYINYRYNAKTVLQYAKLPPAQLAKFLLETRPTFNWLRNNLQDEDLLYYINEKVKTYL